MAGTQWDRESIADLEFRVANDRLTDFAGYASKDELYQSVESMGSSPDPDIRGYVMDILYRLDRERAFSFLVRCLSDPDNYVRLGAVELIGGYGEKITPLLIPLLQRDPSPDVRCCAAGMLGYFGTLEAMPALKQAAERDHEKDFHENQVSSVAKHAIKQIKYRYGKGAQSYDPWGVRSLTEELEIEKQENLD